MQPDWLLLLLLLDFGANKLVFVERNNGASRASRVPLVSLPAECVSRTQSESNKQHTNTQLATLGPFINLHTCGASRALNPLPFILAPFLPPPSSSVEEEQKETRLSMSRRERDLSASLSLSPLTDFSTHTHTRSSARFTQNNPKMPAAKSFAQFAS